MSAHIHTYTYIQTHIQNVHMNARKHAWNNSAAANAQGAVVERGSFARLFRPTQSNHISHFLNHQYPSTPHPLFPTYPRTVRRLRASALLLFNTDQMNRVHTSEEAPRSFTMAPCVVEERFEAKQRCNRAAVSQHAGIQAREWSKWPFTKKREVNEKTTNPCNSPHIMTKAQRPDNIPLICTGVGPIHPVHSQPMSLATEAMPETRLHFCHFPAVFHTYIYIYIYVCITYIHMYTYICLCTVVYLLYIYVYTYMCVCKVVRGVRWVWHVVHRFIDIYTLWYI